MPSGRRKPGIMLLAATGDDRLDPSLANLLAVFVMVVAAIGVEHIRTLGAGCPSAGSRRRPPPLSRSVVFRPVRRGQARGWSTSSGTDLALITSRDVTSMRVTALSVQSVSTRIRFPDMVYRW